jgi:hypothetical protein
LGADSEVVLKRPQIIAQSLVAKQLIKNQMKYIFIVFSLIIMTWGCTSSNEKANVNVELPVELPIDTTKNKIDSFWINSDFDSAVAVILNGDSQILYNILQMDSMYGLHSRRRLSNNQIKLLTDNLSGKLNSEYSPSDCFQPYHGFFFYKNGIIQARLAICFVCGMHTSQPKDNGGINYHTTKQLFAELDLPVYNWDDSLETAQSKIKYQDYFKQNVK